MSEPMSDELANIRERIEHDQLFGAREVAGLIDRIETLQAERDAAVRDRAFQRGLRAQDAAEAEEAEARAEKAEAALDRVTDDNIVRSLASTLAMSYGSHVNPPEGGRDWKAAEDVLAAIRAVAADEQEGAA